MFPLFQLAKLCTFKNKLESKGCQPTQILQQAWKEIGDKSVLAVYFSNGENLVILEAELDNLTGFIFTCLHPMVCILSCDSHQNQNYESMCRYPAPHLRQGPETGLPRGLLPEFRPGFGQTH